MDFIFSYSDFYFSIINYTLKKIMNSKRLSDRQIKEAVDGIFSRYDTDKSGTLESSEV